MMWQTCVYINITWSSLTTIIVITFHAEDEDDGYYFGQEQVPLTDEIKEILEEYPDGQIFKVREYILRIMERIDWYKGSLY